MYPRGALHACRVGSRQAVSGRCAAFLRRKSVRLTKLGHACIRLAKNDANLVIDPGVWSGPGALDGASAVLITHEHPDHLDTQAVLAALAADPGLGVWTNEAVAGHLTAAGSGQ